MWGSGAIIYDNAVGDDDDDGDGDGDDDDDGDDHFLVRMIM